LEYGWIQKVALAKGDGTFNSSKTFKYDLNHAAISKLQVVDVNGDGIQDLTYMDGSSSYVRLGQAKRTYIKGFSDSYDNKQEVTYSKLTEIDDEYKIFTRDGYKTNIPFGGINGVKPYQQALTVVKKIDTPTDTVYYKYAGARMHNGEHGYLGFGSITSSLAKKDADGKDVALVTTSYLHQDYPFVGKLKRVNKKVYKSGAEEAIKAITYGYNDNVEPGVLIANMDKTKLAMSDFTLPTENSIDVAAATLSVSDYSTISSSGGFSIGGGGATGTSFTGQMNSFFEWQSITLAGGVKKAVLKEKAVDHIQLGNSQLLKRETTKADWQTIGGQFARLSNRSMQTVNKEKVTLSTTTTAYTYENTDTYGLPSSFLVNTATRTISTPANSALGLIKDTHTTVTEYDYHSSGLVKDQWVNKTDNNGTKTTFGYDPYGNITKTTLSAIKPTGNSDANRTVNRTYSNLGKNLATETNSLGHTTTYSQYTLHGLPTKVEDAKGLTVYNYYDEFGRHLRTYDHMGNESRVYRGLCHSYSSCNTIANPAGVLKAYEYEVSHPAGGSASYRFWDKQGRLVKTALQSRNGYTVNVWQYDRFGRVAKASNPQLVGLGDGITLSANTATSFTYDELDRVVEKTLPGNRTVKTSYADEKAVKVTDPESRIWLTETNALGQTIAKGREFSAFAGIDSTTRVSFIYDAQGNVLEQHYPRLDNDGNLVSGTHKIVNQYDNFGNQISINDPNTGEWSYQYNAFGELIKQTDANGNVTHFSYDALGRMLTQRDGDTYSLWHYDAKEKGLLDTVSQYDISAVSNKASLTPNNVSSLGKSKYIQKLDYFTQSKLPKQIATKQRNANRTLSQSVQVNQYDRYGRLSKQTLPVIYKNQGGLSAPQIEYNYSLWGHLEKVSNARTGEIYQQIKQTDAWGNLTDQTINGNIKLLRDYDPATGWARSMEASHTTAYNWQVKQEYNSYNKLGLMGEKKDHIAYSATRSQTWSETYSYDDALEQQLTKANIKYERGNNPDVIRWSFCYKYDALGNMRQQSSNLSHDCANAKASDTSNYHYLGSQPHRLQSISGELERSYGSGAYDNNGNVLNDGDKTISYHRFNKVKQVKQGGLTTRFEYGPDRSRTLRVDTKDSKTTETLYVGNYERVATGNNVEHRYTIAGVVQLVQKESASSQGTETAHTLISDYQGSLIAVADKNGDIQQRYRYRPFGGDRAEVSYRNLAEVTTRGYTDHEHIDGTDIIHMNGRIYDSAINRFLQADPIVQAPGFVLSYNRYSYVWNNPINYTDPTGYMTSGYNESINYGGSRSTTDYSRGNCSSCGSSSSSSDNNVKGKDGLLTQDDPHVIVIRGNLEMPAIWFDDIEITDYIGHPQLSNSSKRNSSDSSAQKGQDRSCGGRPCVSRGNGESWGPTGVLAIGTEGTVVEGFFGIKGGSGIYYDFSKGEWGYYSNLGGGLSGHNDALVGGVDFQAAITIDYAPSMEFFSGTGVETGYSIGIFGVDYTVVPEKGSYWGIDIGPGIGNSVVKTETQAWSF